jgi:hypothetical protein
MTRLVVFLSVVLAVASAPANGSAGGSPGSTLSPSEPSATVSNDFDAGFPYLVPAAGMEVSTATAYPEGTSLVVDVGTKTYSPPTVVEVATATGMDGGRLADGWWVSRPQMLKVGEALAAREPTSSSGTFFLGAAAGALVGGAVGAFVVYQAHR